MKYDAIVVGGGIAGLTAAAYLSRAGKTVAVFERQEKVGGLVQSFRRSGVLFDAGLRSIENSGIVFPMLRQLGINIDFVRSPVSLGFGNKVLILENQNSIEQYQELLMELFPDCKPDVERIIHEVRKIMGYMDVLYGIDNPAFLNMKEDREYLFKVILPWMFRFLFTIRKIGRLKEPVDEYLRRMTQCRPLIDMIAQHFFQKTPTSFALSYFWIYLDYHYPKGGTDVLISKLEDYILKQGGEIKTSTTIVSLHPEEKYVIDQQGTRIEYDHLVWAADMKLLYNSIDLDGMANPTLKGIVAEKRSQLKDLKGGDSVFTVYLTVNERKEYFSGICTGHFFYTPDLRGLSQVRGEGVAQVLQSSEADRENEDLKRGLMEYLDDYCRLNTYEISIPVLRDETLAPEGKTGLIVSLLFDHQLARKIEDLGWTQETKEFLEQRIIRVLDESIFPGMAEQVVERFSSSPLTIEHLTGNTGGGITGWAFTNPMMPAENRFLKVATSVTTPIPNIFQAGQWVYSPSGLPISILTGKLAADKVLGS